MIFDRVFWPHAVKSPWDKSPLSANLADNTAHFNGIIKWPLTFFETRVEIVDPFFAILFKKTKIFAIWSLEHFKGNILPLSSIFLSKWKRWLHDKLIKHVDLFFGPKSLDLTLGMAEASDLIYDSWYFDKTKYILDFQIVVINLSFIY